jgi:hypothetical protein
MNTLVDRRQDMSGKVFAGVVGGLVGGLVFGMMMAMMGMIPMIASLVGSHFAISAFIGITFALLLGDRSTSYGSGLLWGIVYGIVWWILGPLVIMPAMMGMPLFMFNSMTMMSLVGHIIYGALLGLSYAWYTSRS